MTEDRNPRGWPRPTEPLKPADDSFLPISKVQKLEGLASRLKQSRLPVMWVAGNHPRLGRWVAIDSVRMDTCFREKLCIVCGEKLGEEWVSALLNDNPSGHVTDGHIKCILLVVVSCPHFKNRSVVAETPTGVPLTLDELRRMKKNGKASSIPATEVLSSGGKGNG